MSKTIGGLPAANPSNLSLSTKFPVQDDAGTTVRATFQQIIDEEPNPIRSSYNLNTAQGGAVHDGRVTIRKTGIAENTATAIITFTVPNAAHAADVELAVMAILGAGGAIGTGEAISRARYCLRIVRTPGLATVVGFESLDTPTGSAVAGATTITLTGAVSAVSGANTDPQTFNFTLTIDAATGSSTNHKAVVRVDMMNENASGVTWVAV